MIIEIENYILQQLKSALPSYSVLHEYPNTSNITFPIIVLNEIRNTIDDYTRDSSHIDNYSNITYDINIFSNKESGRKEQCRSIAQSVDNIMVSLGFSRQMGQEIPNYDTTIFRYYLRYEGKVDRGETDNGVTTYTIYKQ